jgi:hypothetical protein
MDETVAGTGGEFDYVVDEQGVPNAYRRAVTGFAQQLGLDAAPLMAGARLDVEGLGFWLQHHGQRDARALTVMVDVGLLPTDPAEAMAVLQELLHKNVTTPAAACGWYGLVPGTRQCVMCIRVDLDGVRDAGAAVGSLIGSLVEGVRKSREVMQLVMDELVRKSAGNPLEKV